MPRQVCLAQQVRSASNDDQVRTFTIVERAPILLREHDEIWRTLKAEGEKRLVIDDKHSEEAIEATVTRLDLLKWHEIDRVMMQAREAVLTVENTNRPSVLSKELDHCFDTQREWLQLRVVLSQASRGKNRRKRAFLLFE